MIKSVSTKPLPIETLRTDKISIGAKEVEGHIHVYFNGDIDLLNPEEMLEPYFMKLHNLALKMKCKKISLDFKELFFMNSSGIKSLIKWLSKNSEMPRDKQYKFTLLENREIAWQEASFKLMSLLISPELVEIQRV